VRRGGGRPGWRRLRLGLFEVLKCRISDDDGFQNKQAPPFVKSVLLILQYRYERPRLLSQCCHNKHTRCPSCSPSSRHHHRRILCRTSTRFRTRSCRHRHRRGCYNMLRKRRKLRPNPNFPILEQNPSVCAAAEATFASEASAVFVAVVYPRKPTPHRRTRLAQSTRTSSRGRTHVM